MAESIRKSMEAIRKQRSSLDRVEEKKKADCSHTKNGELDIVRIQNTPQGEHRYLCRQCGKELDLNRIQQDTLDKALTTVDNACDTIKLSLDPQREGDAEILKRVSKTQFRVRNELGKLYNASLKKNGKGRGRRNNNGGGNADNSSWGRPTMNGR